MADQTHATSKHYPDMTEPIAKSIEEEKLTLVKTATSTDVHPRAQMLIDRLI